MSIKSTVWDVEGEVIYIKEKYNGQPKETKYGEKFWCFKVKVDDIVYDLLFTSKNKHRTIDLLKPGMKVKFKCEDNRGLLQNVGAYSENTFFEIINNNEIINHPLDKNSNSKESWIKFINGILSYKPQCELTSEFLYELLEKQNFRCQYTLDKFDLENNKPSLDQKVSGFNGGRYEKHNVQWINRDINSLKGVLNSFEFVEFCKHVHSFKEKNGKQFIQDLLDTCSKIAINNGKKETNQRRTD